MKKIYSLVVVLAATLSANAQEPIVVTKSFSEFSFTDAQTNPSGAIDANISFTTAQNASSSAPAFYTGGGGSLRLYVGNGDGCSINFTFANNITVTSVVLNGLSNNVADASYFTDNSTTGTPVVAANNIYTISGIEATQSLKFQNTVAATGGNQIRLSSVTFTYTVEDPTASTTENNIEGLKVFPNPAKELVNITSNEVGTKNVAIYNMLGKKVLETSTEETVNVSTLTSGVYIMKISQDGKNASRKLVIK